MDLSLKFRGAWGEYAVLVRGVLGKNLLFLLPSLEFCRAWGKYAVLALLTRFATFGEPLQGTIFPKLFQVRQSLSEFLDSQFCFCVTLKFETFEEIHLPGAYFWGVLNLRAFDTRFYCL